jgi:hypothetical protein
MIVPIEIARCRNIFGPLNHECRARLLAVINKPTQKTWSNAYSLIVAFGAPKTETLWQAVLAVDPTFPQKGPATKCDENGKELSRGRWSRVPTRDLLLRAIRHATSAPRRREVSR